jgi:hypothetical protein
MTKVMRVAQLKVFYNRLTLLQEVQREDGPPRLYHLDFVGRLAYGLVFFAGWHQSCGEARLWAWFVGLGLPL